MCSVSLHCSFVACGEAQPAFPSVRGFRALRPVLSASVVEKDVFPNENIVYWGFFSSLGSVCSEVHWLTSLLLSIMPVIIFITLNLDCKEPLSVSSQFNTNSHIHLAFASKNEASPCSYQPGKKTRNLKKQKNNGIKTQLKLDGSCFALPSTGFSSIKHD